jgi:membrane protease YdiL (CAAX protease family)
MSFTDSGWDWQDFALVEFCSCAVSWLLVLGALYAPMISVRIPWTKHAMSMQSLALIGSSVLPGIIVVVFSKEIRALFVHSRAPFPVYIAALVAGLGLPFLGAIVLGQNPFSTERLPITLIRVFAINFLLAPLWEEIFWRGFLYPRTSFISTYLGRIGIASFAWAFWHIGFLFFLYSSGLSIPLLLLSLIQYFFVGLILIFIFELSHDVLYPAILFHAGFNAATTAVYGAQGRALSLNFYLATTLCTAAVAGVIFAFRRRAQIDRPASRAF